MMKKSNTSTISFHITKQTNQNTKYFVYGKQNKKYPIDFDLLKKNCNYFYRNRKQFKDIECINLNDENDKEIKEEAIEAFIKSCENEKSNVKLSSIFDLQYLAYKYEYPGLKIFTEECIKEHWEELIIKKLLFQLNEINNEEETFISNNFERYIEDDEILQLPVSAIYRIFEKYKTNKLNKLNKKKIIKFLFKCLDHYGKDASILFNEVDFEEENIEVVNRLLTKYSNEFDFNMINSTMAKTTMKLSSELTKQKEEHLKIFSEMERTISNERTEIIKLREEEEQARIKEKRQYEEQIKEYEKRIKRMENELKERMNNIEEEFKTMCDRYETTISNGKMKKYQNIILEILKSEDFNKFSDELKEHIVEDIYENQQNHFNINNQFYQKILFLCKLFKILTSADQEKHIKSLYEFNKSILLKFVIDQLKEIKMSSEILENLTQKNISPQMIKYMINNFEQISIEIEYPMKSFQSTSKFIQNIIKENESNKNKIKITIELIIKTNPKLEEMKDIQNIIEIVKIDKNMKEIKDNLFKDFSKLKSIQLFEGINIIGNNSFEGCTSLTKISIPSSVNSIGKSAFMNCSTLTEITIPSTIKSIGDNAFEGCTSLTKISIPSSVNSIGKLTFKNCSTLTEITIPTTIKSIGDNAFEGCTSLKEISIPNSVNSIGKSVFKGCTLAIINLFSYSQGKELEGIINYLTNKTGGNIHDNGTIKISASSTYSGLGSDCYDPKNLCDFNDLSCNSIWSPSNNQNSTILFDFKIKAIKLTNYTLHTPSNSSSDNPKSWVVECSNDSNRWFSVDVRNNEQIMKNKNVCHTFKCKTQSENFYRYIRIKSTDTCWGGRYYFDLVAVEFFGSLKEKSQ